MYPENFLIVWRMRMQSLPGQFYIGLWFEANSRPAVLVLSVALESTKCMVNYCCSWVSSAQCLQLSLYRPIHGHTTIPDTRSKQMDYHLTSNLVSPCSPIIDRFNASRISFWKWEVYSYSNKYTRVRIMQKSAKTTDLQTALFSPRMYFKELAKLCR